MNNADKMPIRVPKRRGPPSANYLPLLMMFMLMLSPNTLLTPIIPPPCTPMPESDIYPAAPALHQCSLTRKYRGLRSHLVFYFILFYFGGGGAAEGFSGGRMAGGTVAIALLLNYKSIRDLSLSPAASIQSKVTQITQG